MKPDAIIGMEVTLRVGCPIMCDYCVVTRPDFSYRYGSGCRMFTLESFRECLERGQVPTRRQLTFMGASEPATCPDWTKIIRWSHQRGHRVSLSTTLYNVTRENVDELADVPLCDTVLHVPANDGRMGLKITPEWLDVFEYAIAKWRHHPEFVISCYSEPHPLLKPVWVRSGIPLVHFGLHDREGLIPFVGHRRLCGKIPVCGKLFCGHLWPDWKISRCCGDMLRVNVWGDLHDKTYAEIMSDEKWCQYMSDRQDETKDTPCRYCTDGYKELNPEDSELAKRYA